MENRTPESPPSECEEKAPRKAPSGLEGGLKGGGRKPPTGSFDSPRG